MDNDKLNGLAIIITLICVSIFLFITNGYFSDKIYARIIEITFMSMAFLGISTEINMIFNKDKLNGLLNIFIGCIISFGFIFLLKIVKDDVNKMMIVIILVVPVYSIVIGFLKLFKGINIKKDNIVKNIFLIIMQIVTFVATILQILKAFKIIS